MVEKIPTATSFAAGEADEPLLTLETEDLPPASEAVTSGIRKTLSYLRAEAGPYSVLRGLRYSIIYSLSEGLLNGLFISLLRPLLKAFADILVPVLSALLLWTFNNAWLHKVISKPSQKKWSARVREQSRPRFVLPAIGLWAFCRSITAFITQTLTSIFVLSKFTVVDDKLHFDEDASPRDTSLEAFGIYATNMLLLLLLVLPATIVLVRVQASLLPGNDEAIVPFDKSFGGKVGSDSVDGSNKLSIVDAWRSFGWPGRIRLLKTYVKYFFLQIILALFSAAVLFSLVLAFRPAPTKDGVGELVARVI